MYELCNQRVEQHLQFSTTLNSHVQDPHYNPSPHVLSHGPLLVAPNQNTLPIPLHTSHLSVSKIMKLTQPSPPHLQHTRPPIRGSPGCTTAAPGGGAPHVYLNDGRGDTGEGPTFDPLGGSGGPGGCETEADVPWRCSRAAAPGGGEKNEDWDCE
jgi:hypothetical protein